VLNFIIHNTYTFIIVTLQKKCPSEHIILFYILFTMIPALSYPPYIAPILFVSVWKGELTVRSLLWYWWNFN